MGSSSASCVVVQLGQGGNQLYTAFFSALADLAPAAEETTAFFRDCAEGSRVARAVLIDMEPKVISAAIKRAAAQHHKNSATAWKYCSDRQITRDSGSGNNWARGFYVHGPRCREAISNVIRLEVEACDLFGGFITAQSMAGGTGSGLGAYVIELLRDEYPSACTLSHCIWPYESGEVIVQNYNALLTLAKLQESADGIIISQNESLSSICRKTLGIPRPTFDDMNDVVAHSLASIFLPASWRSLDSSSSSSEAHRKTAARDRVLHDKEDCYAKGGICGTGMPVRLLPDLVSKLCAHPGYRMLSLRFTPQISPKSLNFTTFNWGAQTKQLQQMLVTGALGDFDMDWNVTLPHPGASTSASRFEGTRAVNRCLANLLVLRGTGSHNADVSGFEHESLYPIWAVDPLSVAVTPAKLGRYEISAGLLSNCQSSVTCTFRALARAYEMFASRAYLHQYFQHGMEMASFDAAFATVEDVIARYHTL